MRCASVAVMLAVTACGSGEQSDTNPPRGISGKPVTIQEDLSGASHSLLLISAFAYLNESARGLFSAGDTLGECRRLSDRDPLPMPGSVRAMFQMRVDHECPKSHPTRVSVRGKETFRLENAARVAWRSLPARSTVLRFTRATVETPQALSVRVSNRELFQVDNQIVFTSLDPAAGIYRFESRSTWRSQIRDTASRNLVADWTVTIQGRIRANDRADMGPEVYDPVTNVQATLNYSVGDGTPPVIETASLALGTDDSVVRLDQCGSPIGSWQGVFATDLFPSTQQNLNLTVSQQRISSSRPKFKVAIENCRLNPSAWAHNVIVALQWQRRFRGL